MANELREAIAQNLNSVDWNDYQTKAQAYLSRPVFQGTPIKADHLTRAAQQAFVTHGTIVPVELALAQAQFETSMGRKGRNPSTNPFNVYEFDSGTKKRFKTLDEGVNAYYDLMAKDYLKGKSVDQLLTGFTNYAGNRYASDPDYEKKLKSQIEFIRKQWKK